MMPGMKLNIVAFHAYSRIRYGDNGRQNIELRQDAAGKRVFSPALLPMIPGIYAYKSFAVWR